MNKIFYLCFFCVFLLSCTTDDEVMIDESGTISIETALKKGMLKFTQNMGEWDAGVVYAEDSYLLYEEDDDTHYLQFMTPGNEYDCGIYANESTYLPEMLCFGDDSYYYINSGDTAIIVSRATENGIEQLDSIGYVIENESSTMTSRSKITTITHLNRDDKIKKVVKSLDAVLNAGDYYTSSQINRLKKALDDISVFYYYENVDSIIDELDLCRERYGEKGDSVIWCFTKYAKKIKISTYESASYSIAVKTGGSFNVGTTTAYVNGRIFCASEKFREKGKWGIVYSTDPDNLTLENNLGCVYADPLSKKDFVVKLTGLRPNKTYYYKTFYDFSSKDHGDLHFRYGDRKADNYVDNDFFMKEFTTLEPRIESFSIHTNGDSYGNKPYWEKWDDEILGCIFPVINVRVKNVDDVYGWKILLRNPMNKYIHVCEEDYFRVYDEPVPFSSLENLTGKTIFDKWTFSFPASQSLSGSNSIKVVLKILPDLTIETDWIDFNYSYSGIY